MTDFIRNNNYDGVISTPLPDSSALTFNFKYVLDRDESLVWYGEYAQVYDTIYKWGNLLYIDDESGKFGTFTTKEIVYEIIDLSGDVQVLVTLDSTVENGACAMDASFSESVIGNSGIINNRDPDLCLIRVFATYTAAAAGKVASIDQTAKIDIQYANMALRNSSVSRLEGEFVFVGSNELETFDYTHDDSRLDRVELSQSEELEDLQIENEADLMIVYVPRAWVNTFPYFIYGLAGDFEVAGQNLDDNLSFAAYSIKATIRDKLFAHEAAHVIGARHQEQDDDTGEYQHAHSIELNQDLKVYSIVWGGKTKKFRMPHYSNPDISFLDHPTGTSTRNNARKIREEGCATSQIKPLTAEPFTVSISGPDEVESGSTNYFSAVTFSGQSPFTFEWHISFNGIDFQSLNEDDDFISLASNYPEGTRFILKVVVTGDDTKVEEGFLSVIVVDYEIEELQKPKNGSILFYVPNPANDNVRLTFSLTEDTKSEITINIFNISGFPIINSNMGILKKGVYNLVIDVSLAPSGYLFVGLLEGEKLQDIKPLIKI